MVIAPGHLDPLLASLAILAIAAGAGAAGVLNMWYDADIDALMPRTAMRPIPRGAVSRKEALVFGLALAAAAVVVLALALNITAAALLAFTIFFYVVVYTVWLKRHTPQNIVIGGAAGALPPVIGWAAATGEIGLEPLTLFLIIFLWTPPHFWALSLNRTDEYARAGVPMLPVVAGAAATTRQILIYSGLLVFASVLPWALGFAGTIYGAAAAICGAIFVALALQLARSGGSRSAGRSSPVRVLDRLFVRAVCGPPCQQLQSIEPLPACRVWHLGIAAGRIAVFPTHASLPSPSRQTRSNMRYGPLAVVLIGAAMLGGCSEGVLDPKGPIAAAERQILFNSLGIMLAIVIPTILATLGVAFWFRSSNTRAGYLPDFDYSGRLEMLVWSIPAMTVLLVGGVAWVGCARPRSAQADRLYGQARQGPGRLARLEMAVHLSRPGHRERQSTDHPGRHAGQLRADLLGRDEQLLRAAARQPDLHHGREW